MATTAPIQIPITGEENITDLASPFTAAGRALEVTIRTTRIFRFRNGRWRQVHHHGSIDDAQLLAAYQAATR
jgi:hypothetical protein